jgi:hypothetical protein
MKHAVRLIHFVANRHEPTQCAAVLDGAGA